MILTTSGPMDEATLVRSEGVIDDETRFVRWVEYRVPGESDPIYRSVNGFEKVNPFVADRGVIDIDRGNGFEKYEESTLQKVTGTNDNENEFSSWVECYLDGALVHRSAYVKLKKGVAAVSAVGGLG